MNMPQALQDYLDGKSLRRFAAGAVFGFALVGFLGFGWMNAPNLGFKTAAAMVKATQKSFTDGQISLLAADCAKGVAIRPDAGAMKVKLAAATSGWDAARVFEDDAAKKLITMPGGSYPDSDLARACGLVVSAAAKTAAR